MVEIAAPIDGKISDLCDIDDIAFSSKKIGEGIAIDSEDNIIFSPLSGEITAAYLTKHAIGITSDESLEVLIHIGLEIANLNGQYFSTKVGIGDIVEKGDELITFDRLSLERKGYNLEVIVILLESSDYLDAIPVEKGKNVKICETILTVIR